ncbi:hypothetical protein C2I36_05425 [Rhodobacteraceae bacterium WD3A24]|nr:hypothetical protein C2I36_05425 [Rhodobacteraceae bacterium WD3A24]
MLDRRGHGHEAQPRDQHPQEAREGPTRRSGRGVPGHGRQLSPPARRWQGPARPAGPGERQRHAPFGGTIKILKSGICPSLSSDNAPCPNRCHRMTAGSYRMAARRYCLSSALGGKAWSSTRRGPRHAPQAIPRRRVGHETETLRPMGDRPMTIATTIRTAAFTLMMGAGLATAAAAGGNSVTIEQWGSGNAVGGAQSGHGQRLSVYQDGWSNTSINTQDGYRNRTVVGQRGHRNTADTDQRGRGNIAGVAQFGGHNEAEVDQRGRRNAVGVIQSGHGNSASTSQHGNGNVAVIVQD